MGFVEQHDCIVLIKSKECVVVGVHRTNKELQREMYESVTPCLKFGINSLFFSMWDLEHELLKNIK
jgi:hypothetical protein